jgi:hypothetical protein
MRQTTRTLVSLAILLVAAGGVGLYAWRGVYQADQVDSAKKERDERLFSPPAPGEPGRDGGTASTTFVRLAITFEGTTTVLERQPGAPWRVTAPIAALADRLTVDAIVSQLETASFKATLDESPDPATLERYGLDHPTFVVEATAETGDARGPRTLKLEGGLENSFDGTTFVRRSGEKPVFTVPGGVRYALAKSTYELRDKQVLAIDEGSLERVTVKAAANRYTLARTADGSWALGEPTSGELVDPAQVSAMLSAQSAERAQAFPPNGSTVRRSFDAPALDVSFLGKDGQSTRVRVARSAEDGGERWYALKESDGATVLALVGPAAASHLDRNPAELRDKTLVRFKKELVTRIVLSRGGSQLVLDKASVDTPAEAWRVVSPKEGKAKVFKVTSLLWTLGGLKASAWGTAKPKDWAHLGIDGQARSITLFGADGAELGRLTIGHELEAKKGTFYARGTKDQVAECDGARLAELPFELTELLDEPVDAGGPQVDDGAPARLLPRDASAAE